MKRNVRGFTLVDILIVVIILGILAAIVIPQFTNASTDARNNSIATTLQTIRGQIELFKIQHGDQLPGITGGWTIMLTKTNTLDLTGSGVATGVFGPYLQNAPVNPANGMSAIGASASTAVGWVWNTSDGSIKAVSTNGTAVLTY